MDLSVIKQKLEAVKSKPKQKQEKIDYSKIFWKPKVGTHVIRIVPSVIDKQNPFREIFLHYGFGKFPIFALTNWGEQDPIVDFAKELKKSKDKEDWSLASKLSPKLRVFMPIVVRGEEELGTRLWEVGKGIYQELLGIANDEDYGDYTDIMEGRDFTVEASTTEVAGRKGISCAIRIKPKTSPITKDEKLLEKILNEQPDILEINARYKYTYDGLKELLQKWMNPEDASEGNVASTVALATDDDEDDVDANHSDSTPEKTTATKKFDKLFN